MGITTKVVTDLEQRLARVRTTAGNLEARRRAALQELRQSIRELRKLGNTLTSSRRNGGAGLSPPAGAAERAPGAAALQLADEFGLSLRELEVALLIAQGFSNREIASTVRVSTHTARHHTQHVLGKLGVRSRSRAAALINDFLSHVRTGGAPVHP
jgi:ATP/maltotriose-dependent transcriptional regulator MalT